jgi:uncharacterized protein (TIGR03083 family)
MTDEDLVLTLQSTWGSLSSLLDELNDAEWGQLTDCPGWTVRDQVSHITGFEQRWFLGQTTPSIDATDFAHVHNDLGAENQAWVERYRSTSVRDLKEEFAAMVEARVAQLHDAAAAPDGLSATVATFRGGEQLRDVLALRLFDVWVHEQDIRRAVGRRGNDEGPAMLHARDRMLDSLPWVAAKRANFPDGTVVGIALYGSAQLLRTIRVHEGRGETVQAADYRPAAAVTMHEETFLLATTGRVAPEELIRRNKMTFRGDVAKGKQLALALRTVLL